MQYILILAIGWLISFAGLFLKKGLQSWISFFNSCFITIITGVWAYQVFAFGVIEDTIPSLYFFNNIYIKIDELSAIFILLCNIIITLTSFYQIGYLKRFYPPKAPAGLHLGAYIWLQIALNGLFISDHIMLFLVFWESMSITSFLITLYKGEKETITAAINYLIQMHIGLLCLVFGFIWLSSGSADFNFSHLMLSQTLPPMGAILLIIMGFGIKAGLVPFHSWIPRVHPVCIGSVHGIMSGIVVNAGLYGLMRTALLIPQQNLLFFGILLSVLSLITALYGIIMASIQNDIKKLLAYCTVENMGIVGTGIGLGLIGKANGSVELYGLGFGGAILHTINHSVFKSTIFVAAYEILNKVGSSSIEKMGGLLKKMPFTAVFFLIGIFGLMGLPPLTGFLSEFMIYKAMWTQIFSNNITYSFIFVLIFLCFALKGGLCIFTFTKTYGIMFLGNARSKEPAPIEEVALKEKITLVLPFVGLSLLFITPIFLPTILGIDKTIFNATFQVFMVMKWFWLPVALVIGLFALLYFIRSRVMKKRIIAYENTWGCGYGAGSAKMQYTSHSFGESITELVPIINYEIITEPITEIFPKSLKYETVEGDKIENYLILRVASWFPKLLAPLRIFQNGKTSYYVLYGVVFLILLITLTVTNIL